MTETGETTRRRKRTLARVVTVSAVLLCLLPVCGYLLATVYLHTPSAARRISRILTDYLQYPVTVAGIGLAGRTVSINGLTVGNPVGFSGGELVASRSITITPSWRDLLRGRKNFDEISLRGLTVTVGRNSRGDWNFRELARLLSQKKGGGETFIKRLTIGQASLAVEGVRLDDLALTVNDLSTKGVTGSRMLLTGRDAGGDPFRMEGSARLGGAPSVEVAFAAPSFALQTFAGKGGPGLAHGRGALSLNLKLHEGKLAARGRLGIEHLALALKDTRIPVKGELAFAGGYDPQKDELSLDECAVRVNGIIRWQASGMMRQARTKRSFTATVTIDGIDIKTLYAMLPPGLRGDLAPAGVLRPSVFRFSGDGLQGITAGGGTISLRGGAVAKGKTLLGQGLAADASLVKVKDGWQLRGRAGQEGETGGVLQAIAAPFAATFSNRLKPLSVEVPSFAARVFGFSSEGKLSYRPAGAEPLTFQVDIRKGPVSSLNHVLAGKDLTFAAGTAAVSLRGAGRGPREFKIKLNAACADLRGSGAGKRFAVKEGVTETELIGSGGTVSAAGSVRWSGGLIDGKKVDFAGSYGVQGGEFLLKDGALALDRAELRFARLRGKIPVAAHAGAMTRLPLRLEANGVTARSDTAGADGMSGRLAVDYISGEGMRWLEGDGGVAIKHLTYKKRDIGALEGGLKFTRAGAVADIRGKLLEGGVSGTAHLDPFDPERKAGFSIDLDRAQCGTAGAFMPDASPVKVANGLLGVKAAGSYGRTVGLQCRLEADARGITLTGRGGRTLLTEGGVRTVSELAKDTLSIRECSVSAGKGVALHGSGELTRPLSPDREGTLSLSLGATSIDAMLTAFANVLPGSLQESSVSGTIGGDGRLRVSHKQVLFDGKVSLTKAGLEIPSQKFSAGDITGTIPLSLDFTSATGGGRPQKRSYSRDNYPALLASLRQAAKTERTITIGTIRFGGMEFGETSLAMTAGNGLMEITSLESALFEGTLLGEGFFRYGGKVRYGADLIVNNLSLRALCSAYPKIKGYIAGRVDGIASLYGEGAGMVGLRGFTDIWTRSAPDEKMLVSKEFLQKLAGRKFKGIFFRNDRPYDRGEIRGYLEKGYLTFDTLDISHTNFFAIKDLNVTVAPVQNRISLGHLFASIREAATRGKAVGAGEAPPQSQPETDFKWEE